MKITQDVREYAEQNGLADDDVLEKAMQTKAKEFAEQGNQLYL